MKSVALIALILLPILSPVARGGDPTFGTEFEFSSNAIEAAFQERMLQGDNQMPNQSEHDAAIKVAEQVRKNCAECTVTEHRGKFGLIEYQVKFPDGWGFNISVDPAVVEIQTDPATAAELKNYKKRIQTYIFDSSKAVGLSYRPSSYVETAEELTAHLNIGLRSAFENDPKGFMRFLADYANRPALGRGILGGDKKNAPLISELTLNQRLAFSKLVDDVNLNKNVTVDEVIRRMNFEVYTDTPTFGGSASSGRHYQAIGLRQLIKPEFKTQDMPFELRAVRQPKNALQYIRLVELMDARIQFIKNQGNSPIRFINSDLIELTAHGERIEVQALEFVLYVEEIGLKWQDYKSIVSTEIREILNSGFVEEFLVGKINWASEVERNVFTESLVSHSLVSSHIEERMLRILSAKKTPPGAWTLALKTLEYQSKKSTSTASAALEVANKIVELSIKRKINLDPIGGTHHFIERITSSINMNKKVSFIQRCRNLLGIK